MLTNTARNHRRRGAVAVFVMVILTVLIGFAALTVDVGIMYNVRGDLQQAADAAAIAGATALATDLMMTVRLGAYDTETLAEINRRVHQVSVQNGTLGFPHLGTLPTDIRTGWIDLNSATSSAITGVASSTLNAVEVSIRCEDNSPNGAVQFIFAPILGMTHTNIRATATAAFDDRLIGFEPLGGSNPFVPFTIHEDVYHAVGPDTYHYDDITEAVAVGPDGIQEINLYPHADVGNGNFGLLNIGVGNNGTLNLRRQIEEGITAEELESEIGTSLLDFFDEYGDPVTYTIGGNPGLVATLESSMDYRVGEVIAVLLHNTATGNGANMNFRITGIRFARVMEAELNGNNKRVWLQPASYTGRGVRTDPGAPSSGGVAGKLVLVR